MIKNVWSNAVKMNKKSKLFYLADVFFFFLRSNTWKKQAQPETLDSPSVNEKQEVSFVMFN